MSTDLEILFSSAARVEVLRLFFMHPERRFYQREIERETGQPIRAVQREVDRLEGIDLLVRSEEGNRVFYRLNPEYPLLAELSALFVKTTGATTKGVVPRAARSLPPEPSTTRQPFPWMETLSVPPLPPSLRRLQTEGEWDRGY
jgi:DNA-binding transcriptional ArsR family regulator